LPGVDIYGHVKYKKNVANLRDLEGLNNKKSWNAKPCPETPLDVRIIKHKMRNLATIDPSRSKEPQKCQNQAYKDFHGAMFRAAYQSGAIQCKMFYHKNEASSTLSFQNITHKTNGNLICVTAAHSKLQKSTNLIKSMA